jgi:large subunit ribosomal protein L24
MLIKKGDKVKVIAGKDKSKLGVVLEALPKQNRVVVEGINIRKKHSKPSQENQQGGIIEFEAPIHVSNVMVLDPKENKPTRVGYKNIIVKDKKTNEEKLVKVRYAKKSGEILDK